MRNDLIAWAFAFAFALAVGFVLPICAAGDAVTLGALVGCPSKWIFPMVGGLILAERLRHFLHVNWPTPRGG